MNEGHRIVGPIRGGLPNPRSLVRGWIACDPVAAVIFDSFNVSSVTNNAAGDYTVTWAFPMAADGGYPITGCCRMDSNANGGSTQLQTAPASTSVRVTTVDSNQTQGDCDILYLMAWEKA